MTLPHECSFLDNGEEIIMRTDGNLDLLAQLLTSIMFNYEVFSSFGSISFLKPGLFSGDM